MEFRAKDESDPKMVEAARIATLLLTSEYQVKVRDEAIAECVSQIIFGNEPSEGIPDVRPKYPRYYK